MAKERAGEGPGQLTGTKGKLHVSNKYWSTGSTPGARDLRGLGLPLHCRLGTQDSQPLATVSCARIDSSIDTRIAPFNPTYLGPGSSFLSTLSVVRAGHLLSSTDSLFWSECRAVPDNQCAILCSAFGTDSLSSNAYQLQRDHYHSLHNPARLLDSSLQTDDLIAVVSIHSFTWTTLIVSGVIHWCTVTRSSSSILNKKRTFTISTRPLSL